jgi:hypothetical protein
MQMYSDNKLLAEVISLLGVMSQNLKVVSKVTLWTIFAEIPHTVAQDHNSLQLPFGLDRFNGYFTQEHKYVHNLINRRFHKLTKSSGKNYFAYFLYTSHLLEVPEPNLMELTLKWLEI